MTSCIPSCDATGCVGINSSEILIHKINNMIADNYTLLFVLLVLIIIIGLALSYFITSLIKGLSSYFKAKQQYKFKEDIDNPRLREFDDNTFYEDTKEDPEFKDPTEYLDKNKKQVLKNMSNEYGEYNKLKSEYITSNYNGRQNDDVVDKTVMFKDYDNYKYNDDDLYKD